MPAPTAICASGPKATIYRVENGSPGQNMDQLLRLMGGVGSLFEPTDLVVIKPNVQWWNQGATNLAAIASLVDLIAGHGAGFRGEIVLAENCHRGPTPWLAESSGWVQSFSRNSDLDGIDNMAQLAQLLKKRLGDRFSLCHWVDVAAGARRVRSPADGPGYVYCDGTGGTPLLACDNGVTGPALRRTLMTYPVFRTDRGTLVDLKNGIYEDGHWNGRRLRFVNMSGINHHSLYCGATGAIKNYLGVVDLSGGADPQAGGTLVGDYYNFHSFPFNEWAPGPVPGMLGRAVGTYLTTIRRADLNIITAQWVGLASRTRRPAAETRTILASIDPVALDYHAGKYLLYANSRCPIHNPDDPRSPFRSYLLEAARTGAGVMDESNMEVISYDCRTRTRSSGTAAPKVAAIDWGKDLKTLAKYLLFRFITR